MPLDSIPDTAENIIKFDGTPGRAAKLNYSVPLPGHFVGRRAIVLDLGIADDEWTAAARGAGADAGKAINLKKSGGGWTFNPQKAVELWLVHARAAGVAGDQIAAVEQYATGLPSGERDIDMPSESSMEFAGGETESKGSKKRKARFKMRNVAAGITPPPDLKPAPDGDGLIPPKYATSAIDQFKKYLGALDHGVVVLPQGKFGGGVTSVPAPTTTDAFPMLMLIEIHGISSFLSDYGLGRTIKTFTLLPGESTTISLKTWKSSESKRTQASTILDSFQQSSAEKFRSAIQNETGYKQTKDTVETPPTSPNPGVIPAIFPGVRLDSIGVDVFEVIKVNATGGHGTEIHTTRDDFSKLVLDVTREHASDASVKRDNTVTSSSEWSEKSTDESVTERTIKNVNLRRVLNFVFRELNQEYITKIHLKEIRIGFTNGRSLSYREVPLSGLRTLLQDMLVPGKVDAVAKAILKRIAVVFDHEDEPVPVLETFTMKADGQDWERKDAAMVNGVYPPPTDAMFYRFKRGYLGSQKNDPNPVEGVLLKLEEKLTLRTDSVIVEALLGQADALDEYAMEMQRAEAEAKTLANERERLAQQALQAITDAEERTKAFTGMFKPNDELLKVELINNGER
ncbi:MAG TPA: hypothetical protein VGS96_06660 [Thermoanaerobaculia bacterium]|jgi:hypothetical protein|nr:hypothetical protein [Thermoanaerobaculia bacterium]